MHCTTGEHWSLCEGLVAMIVESVARPSSYMVIYAENSVGDTNYTCNENSRLLIISPAKPAMTCIQNLRRSTHMGSTNGTH